MDLGSFEEFALTIAVGVYCLVGLLLIVNIFVHPGIWRWIQEQAKNWSKTTAAAVILASLIVGMFAEGASDRFVGFTGNRFPIFSSDATIRARVLFKAKYEWVWANVWPWAKPFPKPKRPSPLVVRYYEAKRFGYEIAGKGLFSLYAGGNGRDLETAVLGDGQIDRLDAENVEAACSAVYFQAKNIVYGMDTYYDELSTRQGRIDFARSFTFASACLLVMLLMVWIWKNGRPFGKYLRRPREIERDSRKNQVCTE